MSNNSLSERFSKKQINLWIYAGSGVFSIRLGTFFAFPHTRKAWLHASSSQLVLSDLWSLLWTEPLDFAFGVEFKLMHFTILETMSFLGGIVMLLLSRKWFPLAGETVMLACPYCKNQWRTSRAKGLAECPHCRQFVQPQVKKTG